MKAINYILAIAVLALSACSSGYQATSSYDDIYYEPNDKYLNDYSYDEEAYQEVEEEPQQQEESSTMTNKYESNDPNSGQQVAPHSESYRGDGGTTVVNNYYDAPYDYYYSSRIRRFHRPYTGFSYYSGGYTDYRWYDPHYNGVSIYFSWGTPWYASTPGYHRYYQYPYHSYHYNSWRYDPWYSPYGYGGSPWSYNSGYRHGYSHGFHDGYYYGSGGYYGGYNQYGYNDNNAGYTPTEYHYGPRYSMSSNSGMRGGRSEVKYGKVDGKSGSSDNTVGGNRGSISEEKVADGGKVQNGGSVNGREGKAEDVDKSTGKRDRDVFEKNRSEEVRDNSGLKPSHRSVAGQQGPADGSSEVRSGREQTDNSLSRTGGKEVNRSGSSNQRNEIRRNDFIQNRSYSEERRGYSTSTTRQNPERGRGSDYEPMNRDSRSPERDVRQNTNSGSRDRNVGRTPSRTPERNNSGYNRGERESNTNERRNTRTSEPSREYSTPQRSSEPQRNYSPPKRQNNNNAPKRNYSPPKRNSNNSGSRINRGSRNNNSYSAPSRNRSSGSSGGSRGGSINNSGSSSPNKSNNSGGGRRHR